MNLEKFKNGAAYVGGGFVPIGEASIPVTDWGFTRSDVVYDVVHVFEGRFFRLKDHLDRFARSMNKRRLDVGLSTAEIEQVLHRVVSLSQLSRSYVAMAALRGRPIVAGSRRPADCANHLIAYAIPWVDVITPAVQEEGATLWITEHPRVSDASVDPTVKNYQWSDLTTGLLDAHDHGHETAVLCDVEGYVTEGPGFNVFVVKDGRVSTPDRGVLPGITRQTVLELCGVLGIPHAVEPIARTALEQADELFVTSTAGGVMPIEQVRGGARLAGAKGPLYMRIRDAYWAAHSNPTYSSPVIPD